jgi:alpha-mannosidase
MGIHHVTYSILPMSAPFSAEVVVRSAYDLNQPLTTFGLVRSDSESSLSVSNGKEHTPQQSLSAFSIDSPQIIIETVKLAEDGNDIILRLYEASGGSCSTTLRSIIPIGSVEETNMLERNPKPVSSGIHTVDLSFRAFEIKTLRLRRGK